MLLPLGSARRRNMTRLSQSAMRSSVNWKRPKQRYDNYKPLCWSAVGHSATLLCLNMNVPSIKHKQHSTIQPRYCIDLVLLNCPRPCPLSGKPEIEADIAE